jgi:hypothetical protein
MPSLERSFFAAGGRVNAYGCRSDEAPGISEVQNKIFRLQMRASDKSHEQHVIKPRDLCKRDLIDRVHLA